jgi:hypothetical protein
MDEHTHNVALFFGLTPEGGGVPENVAEAVAKATKAAVLNAAKDVGAVKTVLSRPLPVTQWLASGTQVIALLRKELSDISIPGLLANGWTKYDAFRKFCKEPEHPPTTTYVVPLFKHSISSKYRPVIELRLDGVPAGKVSFEVEVSVAFEEVSVVIRNKRFMAVQTGAAQAKGTLKCEGTQILEHALAKIDLPGKISFGDGFLIEPLSLSNVPKPAARRQAN